MRGKIDTIYGWLRVVKTRPVSYGWSDQTSTTLNVKVKPPKTSLGVMVEEMKEWTRFSGQKVQVKAHYCESCKQVLQAVGKGEHTAMQDRAEQATGYEPHTKED